MKKFQQYIPSEINVAKANAKGIKFGDALKFPLIISGISCAALFLYLYFKKLHYGELLGGPLASDRITDNVELLKRKAEYNSLKEVAIF